MKLGDSPRAAVTLAVLFLANVVAAMDKVITSVLGESLKVAMGLTDTQLGLLSGLAFMLAFSLLSVPLARLADRGMRKWVIAGSLAFWSAMTTLSGLTQSFGQLVCTRVGVAAGEAGVAPASQSLIALLFPARRRGFALAVFGIGAFVGVAIGALLAGWINDRYGWRVAFFVFGPLGALLIAPVLLTVREPRETRVPDAASSFSKVARELALRPAFQRLWLGSALAPVFASSVYTFFVPFFVRIHHIPTAQAAGFMGAAAGIGGVLGTLIGGVLYDRLAREQAHRGLLVPIVALPGAAILAIGGWLVPDTSLSLFLICFSTGMYVLFLVPIVAAGMSVVPVEMRATAAALLGLGMALIGNSCGPIVTGALSDALQARFGADALRYGLCAAALVQIASAMFFVSAYRTLGAPRGTTTSPIVALTLREGR